MTKEEALDLALDLALEALEKSLPRLAPYGEQDWLDSRAAITAIKQALAAPVQEPVAWVDLLKQAEEVVRSKSLWKKYIDGTPLANDIAVWMASFAQEHTTLPAQPAPVQEPFGYLFQHEETGLTTVVDVQQVDWGFEKNNPRHQKIGPVYTTPPAAPVQPVMTDEKGRPISFWGGKSVEPIKQPAPASWMEMVTANLVREGVNKHKARELAEHFYGLAQRPWVGLTDEEVMQTMSGDWTSQFYFARAIETKLRSKNNG